MRIKKDGAIIKIYNRYNFVDDCIEVTMCELISGVLLSLCCTAIIEHLPRNLVTEIYMTAGVCGLICLVGGLIYLVFWLGNKGMCKLRNRCNKVKVELVDYL